MHTPESGVESTPVPAIAPLPPPAEATPTATMFTGLGLTAERKTDGPRGPGWYLYALVGGVKWYVDVRKLGGLDEDLQELATPGFKEAKAERYARESGRPRTEPGPGAV